ncbi:MAG: transposase [Planctomycetes bacterium]|nr:transposase [Planctomycetota bacterium]
MRLVLDNLNTHARGSRYEAFRPEEARRLASRLDLHYTPKHGSWLNMAETELSILDGQCLDRRLDHCSLVLDEVQACGKTSATRNKPPSTGVSPSPMLASN